MIKTTAKAHKKSIAGIGPHKLNKKTVLFTPAMVRIYIGSNQTEHLHIQNAQ